jgi:hypothetical protein
VPVTYLHASPSPAIVCNWLLLLLLLLHRPLTICRWGGWPFLCDKGWQQEITSMETMLGFLVNCWVDEKKFKNAKDLETLMTVVVGGKTTEEEEKRGVRRGLSVSYIRMEWSQTPAWYKTKRFMLYLTVSHGNGLFAPN